VSVFFVWFVVVAKKPATSNLRCSSRARVGFAR